MSELDLPATESAVYSSEAQDSLGLEESKESSTFSKMHNLSYEGKEEMGEEEMGEEEGEGEGEQEEDIIKAEGGMATLVGMELTNAPADTTSAPKKRKKRRRKRRAVRRFGPPHLNPAQIKRSKVCLSRNDLGGRPGTEWRGKGRCGRVEERSDPKVFV